MASGSGCDHAHTRRLGAIQAEHCGRLLRGVRDRLGQRAEFKAAGGVLAKTYGTLGLTPGKHSATFGQGIPVPVKNRDDVAQALTSIHQASQGLAYNRAHHGLVDRREDQETRALGGPLQGGPRRKPPMWWLSSGSSRDRRPDESFTQRRCVARFRHLHGGRSSAGRAPGCGPGGRGFESPRSPSRKSGD